MNHRTNRSLGQGALLALLIILMLPLGSQAADGGDPVAPAAPGHGRQVALGVSQDPDTSLAALDAFAASAGRMPAIWSVWSSWGVPNGAFPSASFMDGLRTRGVVPMIFWEPDDPRDLGSKAFTYRKIIAGKWDGYVRGWARAAKAHGGTILLKFAHEMNAKWFPWGVGHFKENTAERFKKAWRRIHDLIRGPGGEGATNVKLLWSVYGVCDSCASHRSLYPGDAWVEYVGFSSFDWQGNRTMKRIFRLPVRSLQSITRKPIIVTETGTPAGARKASWIRKGYRAVYRAYPRIKAIVYFDVEVFGQPDWRLTQPSSALAAYADVLAQKRFQGRIR